MTCVFKKRRERTIWTQRHKQTEKKVICNGGRQWNDGVTSQGAQRTGRNQEKLEEARKDSSLEPSDSKACGHFDFRLPVSEMPVVLSHPVYGILLQQPWETNSCNNRDESQMQCAK